MIGVKLFINAQTFKGRGCYFRVLVSVSVALIPAAILSDDIVILDGVPAISDVDSLMRLWK